MNVRDKIVLSVVELVVSEHVHNLGGVSEWEVMVEWKCKWEVVVEWKCKWEVVVEWRCE